MNLPSNTWFIIPAYNAAARLGAVLAELNTVTGNIVVVNDGSTDSTADICHDFNCIRLNHPLNLGQGAALQTGQEYALNQGAQILIHFDSDGQMLLKDVPALLEPILAGSAAVAMGSRYLFSKQEVPLSKRWLIHKPSIYLQWLLTGLKLTDAHCGFRAMNREAAGLCTLRQNRMAHATEILELVNYHRISYKEVPVEIIYHHYGQSFTKGFRVLQDLLFKL